MPCLYFTHDNGVYLTSNGEPSDGFVIYAFNCNPNSDFNCAAKSKLLAGETHFTRILPIKPTWLADCDRYTLFNLRVTNTNVSDQFIHPIKAKKKHGKTKRAVQSA